MGRGGERGPGGEEGVMVIQKTPDQVQATETQVGFNSKGEE